MRTPSDIASARLLHSGLGSSTRSSKYLLAASFPRSRYSLRTSAAAASASCLRSDEYGALIILCLKLACSMTPSPPILPLMGLSFIESDDRTKYSGRNSWGDYYSHFEIPKI